MSDMTLEELIEGLTAIEQGTCPLLSDEGMDNLVEAAIDLLWPKAGLLLRGDGWVLTRETISEEVRPDWMPEGSVRHVNPDGTLGGWVAPTAYVGPGAHVGPDATVSDYAAVLGGASVLGKATVSGTAWVHGSAKVFGGKLVAGYHAGEVRNV